jgi:hypothetical protein
MVDPMAAFRSGAGCGSALAPSRSNIAELNTEQRHDRVARGNAKAGRFHGTAPCRAETAPAAVSTHQAQSLASGRGRGYLLSCEAAEQLPMLVSGMVRIKSAAAFAQVIPNIRVSANTGIHRRDLEVDYSLMVCLPIRIGASSDTP